MKNRNADYDLRYSGLHAAISSLGAISYDRHGSGNADICPKMSVILSKEGSAQPPESHGSQVAVSVRSLKRPARMGKSFQTRVSVVLLAFFTLAAIVFACINLSQETKEQTPIDGVTWFEADGGLQRPSGAAGRPRPARRHRSRGHPGRGQRPPHPRMSPA